jgi:hypothetical protein
VKTASGTAQDLNENLCKLRNIDIEIAAKEHAGFADIFWPMINAAVHAHETYGPEYAVSGKDGVHPGWAGHTLMAYAFLKALGLDGDIGTLTVDQGANQSHGLERAHRARLREWRGQIYEQPLSVLRRGRRDGEGRQHPLRDDAHPVPEGSEPAHADRQRRQGGQL